jgi:hypothetical protein
MSMKDVKLQEEEVDRIHMEENYEVEAWCALFGITIRELKNAVDAVGPSAVKVKYYLKEHNVHTINPLV